MKVVALTDHPNTSDPASMLAPREVDLPKPGPLELLIRVHAAGLTPSELRWYPTSHLKSGEPRPTAIPGHEFSGVVVGIGDKVGSLEIGRHVFGMNDWFAEGAMAQYCIAPFASVAPRPAELSEMDAAVTPIGGLTAWQGLFTKGRLQPGERVLIHGGSGAVGSFAVQFARMQGAIVHATAAKANADFVAELGAHVVIDYESSCFEDMSGEMDVIFDTVGGDALERSWKLLKPGGRMVTVAAGGDASTDPRVQEAFFIVEPDQKQLVQIADLLCQGRIRAVVDGVISLSEVPMAYGGLLPRHGRGKIVVSIDASHA